MLAIKTRELSSVQSDCSAKSSHLENKHAQELTAEREKALQVHVHGLFHVTDMTFRGQIFGNKTFFTYFR